MITDLKQSTLVVQQTHLASCPLRDIHCTNDNCQVTLKRKDLSEHVSVTCQWKILLCEFCSEPHPKCQMEVTVNRLELCFNRV